ncbi:MAG: TIGR02996 domain-containing protein [Planctomycetes bacterium]|nr:TIGR02996 domain-containing protein [Planctomycetota bacterium]
MNEEAALLRAICEHPDDDTPRLVFADWLDEQGGAVNAAWAAGIRAQIALARGADDDTLRFQTCLFDSRSGLERLAARLELPAEVGDGWERGFPYRAAASFDQLRGVWPALAQRLPIRTLAVHELTEIETEELVTWPALRRLRELDCAGVWDSPRADLVPILAGSPNLRNLKVLRVYDALLNDANVSALLASPHLAGLEKLQLGYEGATSTLSDDGRQRLTARFGDNVFEDAIPF